jgi:hypothetical protein
VDKNKQMTPENTEDQLLNRLFEQVNEHLETRWAYFSLTSTEKISEYAAEIAGALAAFTFMVLMLLFLAIGFAWWLGDYIHNRPAGFALTGLLFLPIGFLSFRFIRPFVRNRIIESVLRDETPENPSEL